MLASFCALEASDLTWEVIVVDNAGDEECDRIVASFADRIPVRLLRETKQGKNNALNRGVSEARSDLLVFTDDDILASPDWLHALMQGAARWPDHDLFGGRILPVFPPGRKPVLEESHPFYCAAYVVADWPQDEGPYGPTQVWGPNMMVRARLFHEGWSFDPAFGPKGTDYVMGSETEFTSRLADAGHTPVYLPAAGVEHQIREEQLGAPWLFGRSFRAGRMEAQKNGHPGGASLFGAPRYLTRTVVGAWFRYTLALSPRAKLHAGIELGRTRGLFRQYRAMQSDTGSLG